MVPRNVHSENTPASKTNEVFVRIKDINICKKVWKRLYVEITRIYWETFDVGYKLRVDKEGSMFIRRHKLKKKSKENHIGKLRKHCISVTLHLVCEVTDESQKTGVK